MMSNINRDVTMGKDGFASFEYKFVQLARLLNAYLKHFPKDEKFALTNNIKNTMYEVFDYVTEGNKRYKKKTSITNADIANEKLNRQLSLAYELGYFNYPNKNGIRDEVTATKRYMRTAEHVSEIGRMLGGWLNKIKE